MSSEKSESPTTEQFAEATDKYPRLKWRIEDTLLYLKRQRDALRTYWQKDDLASLRETVRQMSVRARKTRKRTERLINRIRETDVAPETDAVTKDGTDL